MNKNDIKSKRNKIILLAVIFILLAITAVFILRYYVNKKSVDVKDVVCIEIDNSGGNAGYIAPSYHYEIDFDSNTVSAHTDDPSAEPRHSDKETTFTEKDKDYFIKYANYYGFFNWKESYKSSIYDMKGVDIHITFKNGMQKNINCYGKFPLTYKSMKKVFKNAFGYDML